MAKEINEQELEQVAGGFKYYHSADRVKFQFEKGQTIMAKLETCYASSTITSRGYYNFANAYFPCYYLEVGMYPNESGWYEEPYLSDGGHVYEKTEYSVTVID